MLWFFIYASYALSFWYGVGLVVDQMGWEPHDRHYDAGVMFTVCQKKKKKKTKHKNANMINLYFYLV